MDARELRTRGEKRLFVASAVVSAVLWILVVVSVVGLLYGLLAMLFALAVHALLLAHLKGSSVRVSDEQLPGVHARVKQACARLGVARVPEVFLVQQGGALNAFATRFLSRDFVVIYSDLLEACGEEGPEADMVIGHEVGHIALGHLRRLWFLLPARLVPWLGAAYSRACEYSCDLCGLTAVQNLDAAGRGLTILAAGGVYGRKADLGAFSRQARDLGGFWASVHELNASHPPLAKRAAALLNHRSPGTVALPKRNLFAYPVAPVFALASPQVLGAAVAFLLIFGVLAAILIPNLVTLRESAREKTEISLMDQTLKKVNEASQVFMQENDFWPCDMSDMDLDDVEELVASKGWQIQIDCDSNYAAIFYQAGGRRKYRVIFFESGNLKSGVEGE